MYARGPSVIKTPVTTTEITKTTTKKKSYCTQFLRFEDWKSYLNYLACFQGQQVLEENIQRINEGGATNPVTTTKKTLSQISPFINTQMPEITKYSPYIRFGRFI